MQVQSCASQHFWCHIKAPASCKAATRYGFGDENAQLHRKACSGIGYRLRATIFNNNIHHDGREEKGRQIAIIPPFPFLPTSNSCATYVHYLQPTKSRPFVTTTSASIIPSSPRVRSPKNRTVSGVGLSSAAAILRTRSALGSLESKAGES